MQFLVLPAAVAGAASSLTCLSVLALGAQLAGQDAAGIRGDRIGGFAHLASPADYGNSGVLSFIVNHDGRVYEKDLGEATEQAAGELKLFEPDESWKPVATESDLQASR